MWKEWSVMMKVMDLKVYRARVKEAILYSGEAWVVRKEDESVWQRPKRAMMRMMCGVTLKDRKSSMELMSMVELSDE